MRCEEFHSVPDPSWVDGEAVFHEQRGQKANTGLPISSLGEANGDGHGGSIDDEHLWAKRSRG